MERKLASIQMIKDLQSLENSDNLMVVTVLGWKAHAEYKGTKQTVVTRCSAVK